MIYETIKKRFYFFFVSVCIVTIILGFIDFVYQSTDGIYFDQPLTLTNGNQLITNKQVYVANELITGEYSFCKHRNVTGIYQWEIINDDTNRQGFFQPQPSSLTKGCYTNLVVPIEKAPTAAGIYHFDGTISYKINELATIVIPLSSNKFEVK